MSPQGSGSPIAGWAAAATLAAAGTASLAPAQAGTGPDVTFASLLGEMADLGRLAEWPMPAYRCVQFSSYDRASTTPDDHETWFANADRGHFLRVEQRQGRAEHVMVDTAGPGAVVRIWSANPAGTLRIYLDGAEEPAVEADMAALLGGEGDVPAPFAAVRSRGYNLYWPIPFASHCLVTAENPGALYYQVNCRLYGDEVTVEPYDPAAPGAEGERIETVAQALAAPVMSFSYRSTSTVTIAAGAEQELFHMASAGAIVELDVRLPDLEGKELEHALRHALLIATFDGVTTVACPLGDFFGTGPGLNAYDSLPCSVGDDGTMVSRWLMPFAQDGRLSVRNFGDTPLTVRASVGTSEYQWTDRSMHLHAVWQSAGPLATRPFRDLNFATVHGRGVWVGDALSIANPVPAWWGEGDEKIYVDGEVFPSHFGTGTEDYYGYAWCTNQVFTSPFHNQPRCDGPDNFGIACNNRFRTLDAIPFRESIRFDMEVWHWTENIEVDYATTSWFYASPGAAHGVPAIDAADLAVPDLFDRVFRVPGALEAEDATITAWTPHVDLTRQTHTGIARDTWSGMAQLWGRADRAGQWVAMHIPVEAAGRYEVIVYPTRSWDYGILQFSINGEPAGEPLDTFNVDNPDQIGKPEPYSLGKHDIEAGGFTLRVEVVGTNEDSRAPQYYFGLDCVVVR